MEKAEKIARAWMPGTRQGSNRPAWAHPQDLVHLLEEMFAAYDKWLQSYLGTGLPKKPQNHYEVSRNRKELADIAWLHDIIEDGRKSDGTKVTQDDLYHEGIHEDVITGVLHLTHREDEEKIVYLARLRDRAVNGGMPQSAIIVKLVDRICNLREGKDVFKPSRWARVIKETKEYIVPMSQEVEHAFLRDWLRARLMEAIDARPVAE